MNKYLLPICALLAAITVLLGALGAHTLKSILQPNQLISFETAVRYQFLHVLALLITGILRFYYTNVSFRWVIRLFGWGIVLFSGSIYLIIFCQHQLIELPRWLFLLTPLGGVCLTSGWVVMAVTLYKRISQKVEN
jgi:uncharacterized membrane protein YgdD (TMEM256/DUF423 family)